MPGEAQLEFTIGQEGAFVFQVKARGDGPGARGQGPRTACGPACCLPCLLPHSLCCPTCNAQNPVGRDPSKDPGLDQKAEYPPEKQEELGSYSWVPVRDTQVGDGRP